MIKKLMIALLAGALCLMGALPLSAQKTYSTLAEYEKLTGKRIEKFNEAPILKIRVAAGELASVKERLSDEPMVVEPKEEIGQYGGVLQTTATSPTTGGAEAWSPRRQYLFRRTFPNMVTIVPNIAKGWDLSEDYETLTVYLRRGMKWSDGVPFTADDFLFWYNDIVLNDELTPVKPRDWCPGGEIMKVEKIDDYTVRFQFAAPYPTIIDRFTVGENPFRAKHYLKRYHINYNPEANEIAKKEGYDYWWQCFQFHNIWGWGGQRQLDVNLPLLDPWVMNKIDSFGNKYFERNPYYWKVDTAGNQLPYIDRQNRNLVEGRTVIDLKAIAGELSYSTHYLSMENYPLYKKGEKKGDYRAMLVKSGRGQRLKFSFNLNHKDPVLRKIFNDLRFRQAMSLAINREEMNDIFFYGKALVRQATANPDVSFHEPWMEKYYAEYDPKRANELLDEMGLSWDKGHKYRLRSDGKTLAITIEYLEMDGPRGRFLELIREYWEGVGVRIAVKEIAQDLHGIRTSANELDVHVWVWENSTEPGMRQTRCVSFSCFGPRIYAIEWGKWLDTSGKDGEKPPEVIKRLDKTIKEWLITHPGTEEYMRLGKEILTINLENLFIIGTIGLVPCPAIIKTNLRNTPGEDMIWCAEYRFWMPYQADQWFFKR